MAADPWHAPPPEPELPAGLDLLAPSVLNIAGMGGSSKVQVTVTFGPTSSLLLPRALAYAARYASECAEISPRVWRASFDLGTDPDPYARAHRLIGIVGSWKATEVEVSGSPEPLVPVSSMTECARGWLRRVGACRAAFPAGPWPKCEVCPLYDPGWAAESYTSPPFGSGWAPPGGPLPGFPPN